MKSINASARKGKGKEKGKGKGNCPVDRLNLPRREHQWRTERTPFHPVDLVPVTFVIVKKGADDAKEEWIPCKYLPRYRRYRDFLPKRISYQPRLLPRST